VDQFVSLGPPSCGHTVLVPDSCEPCKFRYWRTKGTPFSIPRVFDTSAQPQSAMLAEWQREWKAEGLHMELRK
jgi:hypothetical protein